MNIITNRLSIVLLFMSLCINAQNKKEIIFTCGSGITAAILALGAAIVKIDNVAVYDGSWTEWASTKHLPISL